MSLSIIASLLGIFATVVGVIGWRYVRALVPMGLAVAIGPLGVTLSGTIPSALNIAISWTAMALTTTAMVVALFDVRRFRRSGEESAVMAIWRFYQRRRRDKQAEHVSHGDGR